MFHFMDNGSWRRLGESADERSATVRLNFCFNRGSGKTLPATFIRRIPVIVKILPIAERGQFERLAFIHHFFRREAQRLNHDLALDGEIVSQLMRETLEGNVGGLENLIRNICASALDIWRT